MHYNAHLLSLITLLSYCYPAFAVDEHWPYLNPPKTSFSRVIGPAAADATLIIDGRPVFFSKGDEEFRPKVDRVLADAKAILDKKQIVVDSIDLEYLEVINSVREQINDPLFKLQVDSGKVTIVYDPPNKSWGSEETAIYALMSAAYRRAGNIASAKTWMLKVLEHKKLKYGWKSDQVARQLMDLAWLEEDSGTAPKAEKTFLLAIELNKELHGEVSKETASALMHLSNFYAFFQYPEKSKQAKTEALKILNLRKEEVSERPVPEGILGGAVHSWNAVYYQITKLSMYSNLLKIELARQLIEDAVGNDIANRNQQIFGMPPRLDGIRFVGNAGEGIEFLPNRTVLIYPGKGPLVPGNVSIDKKGLVTITTQYAGTMRADRWHFVVSRRANKEAHLEPGEVGQPYPSTRLSGFID